MAGTSWSGCVFSRTAATENPFGEPIGTTSPPSMKHGGSPRRRIGSQRRRGIARLPRSTSYIGTDRLWVIWTIVGLRIPREEGAEGVAAFVVHHGLTGDDGEPLKLRLSQLRKTQKAEWYKRTGGQLENFAVGHSISVAARHYADIPALRHVHEQTLAAAFQDALDAALQPRIVPP